MMTAIVLKVYPQWGWLQQILYVLSLQHASNVELLCHILIHLFTNRMITAAGIHFWMAPGMVFSTGTPFLHWTRNVYWRLKNQKILVKIR